MLVRIKTENCFMIQSHNKTVTLCRLPQVSCFTPSTKTDLTLLISVFSNDNLTGGLGVSATHLDRHGGPVVQLRLVDLRQAGGGDGLVVKRFEELPRALVEVFLEERLHLAGGSKK